MHSGIIYDLGCLISLLGGWWLLDSITPLALLFNSGTKIILLVIGWIGWEPFRLRRLLAPLARVGLGVMGWAQLKPLTIERMTTHPRCVMVFSHTGYSDFILMIFYVLAYPQTSRYFKTLIKPEPFAYAGPFLRWLGGIPATRVADSNGGAVTRIIEELESFPSFALLLSPKGTIVKRPWRSGYYNIAKHFGIPLMVIGADYEQKCLVASEAITSEASQPEIQEFLQNVLREIVPIVPEDEIVPIRPHDRSRLHLIQPERLELLKICSFVFLMLGLLLGWRAT